MILRMSLFFHIFSKNKKSFIFINLSNQIILQKRLIIFIFIILIVSLFFYQNKGKKFLIFNFQRFQKILTTIDICLPELKQAEQNIMLRILTIFNRRIVVQNLLKPLFPPQYVNNQITFKVNYNFAGYQKKKKQTQKNKLQHKNSSNQNDITNLPPNQQIKILKEQIDALLNLKQDDQYLMKLVAMLFNVYLGQNKFKDGLIEYDRLVRKIRSISAFKASPTYHQILSNYRYFLMKQGRYDESLLVTQQACDLIKRGSNTDNLYYSAQLTVMGFLYYLKNEYSQSRKVFQKELKITTKFGDQTFDQNIQCRNNIALLDFLEGKYDIAEKTFIKHAQISKRIIKAKQKNNLIPFTKNYAYLQAISQYKLKKLNQNSQPMTEELLKQKKQLQERLIQCKMDIFQILKLQGKKKNDLELFYKTIATHFMNIQQYSLSKLFIKKSLQMCQKDLGQAYIPNIKTTKQNYQILLSRAKIFKIFGQLYQKTQQYELSYQHYLSSINQYKKQLNSLQAKQLMSLQYFNSFIDCCRKMFYMLSRDKDKFINEAIGFIQMPLHVWGQLTEGIWNLPSYIVFIPFEINIQIAIKFIQFQEGETGLMYLKASLAEIENNKGLLNKKSKKSLSQLCEKLNKIDFDKKNIAIEIKNQINTIRNKLSSLVKE